jgi:hypothetical protein
MFKATNLSPHLFWDTNQQFIDVEKDAILIIQRTLEYGFLNDWLLIKAYYGLGKITHIAQQLRSLEDKAFNFIVTISGCSKQSFRCYTTKQLMKGHWNV